jgi:beta-aspartyl-peptidase (threonine type)
VTTPLLVASTNAAVGFPAAIQLLRQGKPALDAVEVAVRAVEDNPQDHTVGYGGLPNLVGEVELDALIMDGRTLAAGAVAALKGFRNPVSIARRVMEESPHVMLTGEGAAHFGREMGFQEEPLLSDEALSMWRERLESQGHTSQPGQYYAQMIEWARRFAVDPEQAGQAGATGTTGTVVVLARDRHADLAVATSTSGWAWKYPGRVGDTPVVGAGGYADNRHGAAGCTGRGEMAMRAATARSLVLYLKMGMPLWNAAREAVLDLYTLDDPYASALNIVAIDAYGNHVGFSNRPGRSYIFQTTEMDVPTERPRLVVGPHGEVEGDQPSAG